MRILISEFREAAQLHESVKPTVAGFLLVLTSKLTQWDKRNMKSKYYNPNALALLFDAHERVEKRVKKYLKRDDEEALESLKHAMAQEFHVSDLAPARNVVRQIDKFITTGKKPSLIAR